MIGRRFPSRISILLVLLSAALSVAWASLTSKPSRGGVADFRAIYYGARTALLHHDPYSEGDFLRVYRQQGGSFPTDAESIRNFRRSVPICVNLPATLLMVAPFALIPWNLAYWLWILTMSAGLVVAALLTFDLCLAERRVAVFLLCILLANCEVVLRLGNATLIAVSLVCISVWCLIRERHPAIAVLCLALALSLKVQEVGFIWLYFFLAGRVQRKLAVQSLAICLAVHLASIAWICSVSPHWLHELHSNVMATTAKGDLNDPGPSSIGNTGLGMIVSLQSVVSCFRDDPAFYNPVSYLLVGSAILIWAVITVRSRYERGSAWLALASISALSMLPVYHRQYDLKLLLLTIPAATMLLDEGRWIGKVAFAVTSLAIIASADLPLAALVILNKSLHLPQDHLSGELVSILCARTPTIILLCEGVFYLWLYASRCLRRELLVGTTCEQEWVAASA